MIPNAQHVARCAGIAQHVKELREVMQDQCKHVRESRRFLADIEGHAAVKPLDDHLAAMVKLSGVWCDHFNKLRSLVADLEAEVGVEAPTFYVKDYEMTGVPQITHGHCVVRGRT